MATKSILVRLTSQNHPGGQRRRAGVLVLVEPTTVEVTEEQFAALEADPYITILRDNVEAQADGGTGGNDDDGDVDPNKGLAKKTKAALIEILTTELKQEPGKDFNPEATNPALVTLIVELRAKAADGGNDDDGDDNDDDNDDQGGGQ